MRRRNVLLSTLGFLVLTMNLVFPKGGVKIAGLPITVGYILLAFYTLCAFVDIAFRSKKLTIDYSWFYTAFLITPFILYILGHLLVVGVDPNPVWQSLSVAFLISIVLMPTMFLFGVRSEIERVGVDKVQRFIRFAVVFTAAFGLIQFIYARLTGSFIEIPYLTINADDIGLLGEDIKNNRRGDFFKLFSTYNNGNLYGACLLLMLPVAEAIEVGAFFYLITRLALLLTLSRSVWVGWIFYEIFKRFLTLKKTYNSILMAGILGPTLILGLVAFIYLGGTTFLGFDPTFFVDTSLGGRQEGIEETQVSLFGPNPFTFNSEIIYVAITQAFGIVGVCLFFPYQFVGILVKRWVGSAHLNGRINKAARTALVGYAVVGLSDGALPNIPTMAIFWLITMLAITPENDATAVNVVAPVQNLRYPLPRPRSLS
jgi:hypothetical protein